MGALTESMTRLRDEILTLRHDRQVFRAGLERSTKEAQLRVSALRRVIANDLAGARRAWDGSGIRGVQAARKPHEAVLPPSLPNMEHHRQTPVVPPLVVPLPSAGKSHFKKHGKALNGEHRRYRANGDYGPGTARRRPCAARTQPRIRSHARTSRT